MGGPVPVPKAGAPTLLALGSLGLLRYVWRRRRHIEEVGAALESGGLAVRTCLPGPSWGQSKVVIVVYPKPRALWQGRAST
jgi:hypothetical protein